jgi:hypothetical protein
VGVILLERILSGLVQGTGSFFFAIVKCWFFGAVQRAEQGENRGNAPQFGFPQRFSVAKCNRLKNNFQ